MRAREGASHPAGCTWSRISGLLLPPRSYRLLLPPVQEWRSYRLRPPPPPSDPPHPLQAQGAATAGVAAKRGASKSLQQQLMEGSGGGGGGASSNGGPASPASPGMVGTSSEVGPGLHCCTFTLQV